MEIQNFDLENLFSYHLDLKGDEYKDPEKVLAACQVKGHVRAWAKNGNIYQVKWIDTPNSNIVYDAAQLIVAVVNRLAKIQPEPEPEKVPVFEDELPEVEATPAAAKLAEENGVNLDDVPHEGKKVNINDVKSYLATLEVPNESEQDLP